MLLWWEMSRPVGFSYFELKLGCSLEDKRQQKRSLGQHQSFWTPMSQFVLGVRILTSWHFTVHAPHPSHPPASVSVSWDTSSVLHLSQSSFFLCPFCPSAALRHIMHGSVPPCLLLQNKHSAGSCLLGQFSGKSHLLCICASFYTAVSVSQGLLEVE